MRCFGGLSSGDEIRWAGRPHDAAPPHGAQGEDDQEPGGDGAASVRFGTGTVDDGDPRLHDTAAHSLPNGRRTATAAMMVPMPGPGVVGSALSRHVATHRHGRNGHQEPTPPRCHHLRLNLPMARQEAEQARGPHVRSATEPGLGQGAAKVDLSRYASLVRFVALSPAGP